jgi:hypothetical protein
VKDLVLDVKVDLIGCTTHWYHRNGDFCFTKRGSSGSVWIDVLTDASSERRRARIRIVCV